MRLALALALFVLSLCGYIATASAALSPSDFEVTDLPLLQGKANFKHYAGYMPATNGTKLFFWFCESQRSPQSDPVLFWTNGGPGSSSIAYGFWTEHGPFRLTPNATSVELFEYSWNRIASVLYVEAPSGVGFSYSDDPKHYHTNDSQTSMDSFEFLKNFFEVFSDFQSNDFYLTGESYGGHYVPTLAERILDEPNSINMKGFLIGNPGINSDWYFNVNEYAFQTYLWSHGLLPQDAYVASVQACDWHDFLSNCTRDFTHPSDACKKANNAAYKYVPKVWDPYSVLAPTCHDSAAEAYVKEMTPGLVKLRERYDIDTQYNPCIDNWTPIYMNRPDVLKALHVDSHYVRPWPQHPANWEYGSELADIALLFPKFFSKAPQWRILVVSGDADSAVPFMGTMRWMNCLGRPVKKDWENWMLDGDVAGSVKQWDRMSFMTVKGCGHTINTYCPESGYAYYENWLEQNGPFA